ncbi:zinc knuckle [Cooperia oncophora]
MTRNTSETLFTCSVSLSRPLRRLSNTAQPSQLMPTRMIRVMEAHQMVHIMNRKTVRVTAEDEQYRFQSAFYNPPPWSDEPSSYIQTLRWWRENYSDALLIRRTDDYLEVSRFDRVQQEHARGYPPTAPEQPSQRPATTITIPKLFPRQLSPARPEAAGPRSNTPPNPPEPHSGATKRKRTLAIMPQEVAAPPAKSRRSPTRRSPSRSPHRGRAPSRSPPRRSPTRGSYGRRTPPRSPPRQAPSHGSQGRQAPRQPPAHRSRSRFPVREVPSERHGKVEPCTFCRQMGHYSSDCDAYPYLSTRLDIAKRRGICSNCLKVHWASCLRRDPCSLCEEEGHHRSFCVLNPFAINDLGNMPPDELYEMLSYHTYVPPPEGGVPRRRYDRPLRDRYRTQDADRPGPSRQPARERVREPSPRPSASELARDMGFSPDVSDDSY